MPSLKMKTTLRRGSLGGENGLHVCQNSNVISKKSLSCVKVSQQTTELDVHGQILEDACPITEVSTCKTGVDEAIEYQEVVDGEKFQFQMQPPSLVDLTIMGRMDFVPASSPNLETIFSRVLKSVELHSENNVHGEADDKTDADLPQLRSDDSDDNRRSSCDYRICDVSDFLISDMIVADLPFDYDPMYDEIIDTGTFPNYKFAEQGVLFDVAEQYMMLPLCDDTAGTSNIYGAKLSEEKIMDSDDSNLYLAIDQLRSDNDDCDVDVSNVDQAEGLDSQFLSKDDVPNLPNALWSMVLHKEACRKPITLVLDLDETLVHSTLDHSDDADFTFRVFFNMKEQTVYVKQRPFLRTFLEKVAEMFNITVFTASQSIYASQLLDKLDPDGKLISLRAYRESCIFSDGNYTKDLTVLGVDLAKVAIIDNSPQVFRLQVNNGIPIKSWFDDPSDSELVSLLPFLETLAAADDVRPIIAKKFNNMEQ